MGIMSMYKHDDEKMTDTPPTPVYVLEIEIHFSI